MLEEGAGLLVLRWVLCEGEGLAGPSCIGEMWKELKGLWGVVGSALRGGTSVGWGSYDGVAETRRGEGEAGGVPQAKQCSASVTCPRPQPCASGYVEPVGDCVCRRGCVG